MPAPQVATLHGAEVAVPQIEWGAVLRVIRDVGRVARVPPRVPRERGYRRRRRWLEQVPERFLAQQRWEGRRQSRQIVEQITCADCRYIIS